MSKMLINLVIEGNKEALNEIKANVIADACTCLSSCMTEIIEPENKNDVKIPEFMNVKMVI